MDTFSDEQQRLITDIAKNNGFINYVVQVTNSVSGEGDGYIGILNGVSIQDKDRDKKLSLVVKTAPKSVKLREQFPIGPSFLRENYFYDIIFPEFYKFQTQFNIAKPFSAIAQNYGTISEEFQEMIVLENLKENGYKLCNRRETMDSHHLSLVITEYARFHAISLAMRRLNPEKFRELTDKIRHNVMMEFQESRPKGTNPFEHTEQKDIFFGPVLEAVKDKSKDTEAVKNFTQYAFEIFFKESEVTNEEYLVVSHSDCWSTNILFKYEDEFNPNIPTKICLIDWQMFSLHSPVIDISYFFYICAAKKDLNNYMRYLSLYHTALSENLSGFGLDPEEMYPFDIFEQHWKQFSKCGFFMTVLMLPQSLSEKETHNFEKMADSDQNLFDMSNRKREVSDLYKQRMSDLVEFLVENEFI